MCKISDYYQVIEQLKDHHVGEEQAVHMHQLAEEIGLTERETRKLILNIRNGEFKLANGTMYPRIICSTSSGYFLAKNKAEAINEYERWIKKIRHNILNMNLVKERMEVDNQYRLKFSNYEKDLIKTISNDLGGVK